MNDKIETYCSNCRTTIIAKKYDSKYYECEQCYNLILDSSAATNTKSDNKSVDPVNPSHYKGRTVMDIINTFQLSFCLGNVVKYILRHKEKAGLEDLKKAKWYLEEEIRIKESEMEKVKGEN